MNNLQSSLVNAGLVSGEAMGKNFEREKTAIGQKIASVNKKVSKSPSLLKLESAETVNQFKQETKPILLDNPSLIEDVINLAQGLRELEGGKKLLWLLYSTRENISRAKPKFIKQIIKRALRKSNPTVELKKGWF